MEQMIYIESTIPPGMTIAEYRRIHPAKRKRRIRRKRRK